MVKNDTTEVDTSMSKIIGLGVFGTVLALALSYFLNMLYKNLGAANFTWSAALSVLFIIIFFLQSIFIKSFKLNLLLIFAETAGLSIFFIINNYSLILLIAIVLTYGALVSAARKSKDELTNQLKINVHKVAKVSLPKIITAIAILISVLYSQPFFPDGLVVSKNLIKSILAPAEPLIALANNYLNLGLKDFAVDKTVAQIAKNISEENAAAKQIQISPKLIEQQLITSAGQIGLTIKSNESIVDVAYNFVTSKIEGLSTPMRWGLFGIMFLLIFFTIKSFFWFFYWLFYLLIYLFYEILMAIGFCKLSYEQISKEIIIL